ncbi:hypothetical protein GUY61_29815 [Streptomyces sp. GC420]|nr:hypothetical protein [Streptomyces sp. GC420]
MWWGGMLPNSFLRDVGLPVRYSGPGPLAWVTVAFCGLLAAVAFGGLGRGKVGSALVLTLFGNYRGSVRRTGLLWVSPLLLRRRIDVRLRHWRSEPLPAVDSEGVALRVVVLVVWRVEDTARAAYAVEDHAVYLRSQTESALARILSQVPVDVFTQTPDGSPTLRNAEAVGGALTRLLAEEAEPAGIEVFSAQPVRIDYAPEVAEVMHRRRVAALDAMQRESVLTSVVDAVDETVSRLTARGLVDGDDFERKALVKDLTVAFYTGRAAERGADPVLQRAPQH